MNDVPGALQEEAFSLSAHQSFDKERYTRLIKEAQDVEALRRLAQTLLDAWFAQKAISGWAMRQALGAPPAAAATAFQSIATDSES